MYNYTTDVNRRQYLLTVGSTSAALPFLAGCTGSEGDDDSSDDSNDSSNDNENENENENESENGSENESENGSENEEQEDPAEAAQGENIEEYKGLQIAEHELVNEGDEYMDDMRVNGIVENTRDDSVDYVEVRTRVYDGDGNQLDSYMDNTTNLQAGGSWKFSVMIFDEEDEIGEYDIQVKDNPF